MILGVDGFAGAGKDTVADILVTHGFTKVSFADELREVASVSFNLPMEYFIDRDIKDKPFDEPMLLSPEQLALFCVNTGFSDKVEEVQEKFTNYIINSPRHLLQVVGTDVGRELLSPTIWLDAYRRRIDGLSLVVTPDARFSNERDLIHSLHGRVIYVSNKRVEASETHKSGNDKWPIDKYDVVIHNDGSWVELQYNVGMWWVMTGRKR